MFSQTLITLSELFFQLYSSCLQLVHIHLQFLQFFLNDFLRNVTRLKQTDTQYVRCELSAQMTVQILSRLFIPFNAFLVYQRSEKNVQMSELTMKSLYFDLNSLFKYNCVPLTLQSSLNSPLTKYSLHTHKHQCRQKCTRPDNTCNYCFDTHLVQFVRFSL